MKKFTSYFVIVFVLLALLSPALVAVAEDPIAESVTLKSTSGDVKIRTNDDISFLTDGDKVWTSNGKDNFNIEGIVLFQNTKAGTPDVYPTCDLIIDLGATKSVDTVNVTFYHYFNAIIDTPKDKKITISYSLDGTDFSEIDTYVMDTEASAGTSGIIDENISLGETVTASHIMVSVQYGDYPTTKPVNEWFGFTELSAGMSLEYGNEESVDTSEPAPVVFGDLYITQINDSVVSASGTIFTRGGVFCDDNGVIDNVATNLAYMTGFIAAPTEADGVYVITEKLDAVATTTVVTIPVDGFIYAASSIANTSSAWYTIASSNVAATGALVVGDVITLQDVDLAAGTLGDEPGLLLAETGDTSSDISAESETESSDPESTVTESEEDDSKPVSTASTVSEETPTDDFPWVPIVIVVGVVAIGAAVALVLYKKKKV